jgi:hypothetical protein
MYIAVLDSLTRHLYKVKANLNSFTYTRKGFIRNVSLNNMFIESYNRWAVKGF